MIRANTIATVALAALAALAAACESPVVDGAAAGGGAAQPQGQSRADQVAAAGNENNAQPPANAQQRPPTANAAQADGGAGARPPPLALNDNDFTESDRTRDPFRSFAREFVPATNRTILDEHTIKLRQYGIDELRLVAVILGTGNPYAMVIDPTGRGTIVRRGDYVGRPETVSGAGEGAVPYQVPWRVARIVGTRVRRDAENNLIEEAGEVVFEREDRLNPAANRAERVLTLAPGAAANRTGSDPNAQPGQNVPALPPLPGFGQPGSPFLPPLPPAQNPNARPGQQGAAAQPNAMQGQTYVQQYTTILPPREAQPAQAPTVIIQTGPQGQTQVQPGGQQQQRPGGAQPGGGAYQGGGGAQPGGGQQGGGDGPPPVVINSGPSIGAQPMPQSGLSR